MSTVGLLKDIQKNAELEVESILQKARDEANQLIDKTKKEIEENKKISLKARIEEIQRREKIELSTIKIDQKIKLLNVREEIIQRIFIEAEKRLKEVAESSDPRYINFLNNAVIEGAKKISGNKIIILTNNSDKKKLKKNLELLQKEVTKIRGISTDLVLSSENIQTLGGVILHTEDMHQYYNNTIEARLTKFREEQIEKLIDVLLKEG